MWFCIWTLSKWCFSFFFFWSWIVNSCFEMHKFSHLSFLRIDRKTNTLNFWWPWNLGESVLYIVGLFGASLEPTSGTLHHQSVEAFHWMYTLHATLDSEREHNDTSDPFLGLSIIPSACLQLAGCDSFLFSFILLTIHCQNMSICTVEERIWEVLW